MILSFRPPRDRRKPHDLSAHVIPRLHAPVVIRTSRLACVVLSAISTLAPRLLSNAFTKGLPDGSVERLVFLETGHSDEVTALAFSPDGHWLASASRDRSIKVWDVARGSVAATLLGHTKDITSIAFSPDSKTLASSGEDATVRLWRSEAQWASEILAGTESPIYGVTFSSDGQVVLYGDLKAVITARDMSSGAELFRLTDHGVVKSLAVSRDGRFLASASNAVAPDEENSVAVWDLQTQKELYRQSGYPSSVARVVFSPDGRYLATASDQDGYRILDVKTGSLLRKIEGQNSDFIEFTSSDGLVTSDVSAVDVWKSWDEPKQTRLDIDPGFVSAISSSLKNRVL